MLKCKEITEQASAFIDDDMSLMARFQFRLHLLMCVHCRRFVHNFRAGVLMVKRLPTPKVTAKQIEEIEARLARRDSSG